MTIIVNWKTPTSVDQRRTALSAEFTAGEGLFLWGRYVSTDVTWPAFFLDGAFAPRLAEHSTATEGIFPVFAGDFALLPIGGWQDSVTVFAESTAAAAVQSTDPDVQVEVERFGDVRVTVGAGILPADVRIVARLGSLPWEWHVVYDGATDTFAPLFAASTRTGFTGRDFTLRVRGGWWGTLSLDVLAVL